MIDHLGDLDVLDCDTRQIRHCNLVIAGSTEFGILDYVAASARKAHVHQGQDENASREHTA